MVKKTQNMSLCHIEYFELKTLKKQQVQERHSDFPFSPRKQELKLSSET